MSAFMVGYMLFSPVFGPLGDRKSRPKLMALGAFGWSLATLFSGFAKNLTSLLCFRAGVGIGEASFCTIAPSYLRDHAGDEVKGNRYLAFFYISLPMGAAIGYVIGGFFAKHWGWQHAFWVASIPGFLMAALCALLPEQPRALSQQEAKPTRLWTAAKKLSRMPRYRRIVVGYIAYTFSVGGFAAWAPKYGVACLNAELSTISTGFGAVTLLSALVGTFLGGAFGNYCVKEGKSAEGFSRFSGWTSLIAFPVVIAAFTTSSLTGFLILMFVAETFLFASTAPINSALLGASPVGLVATGMAVNTFAIHAFGDLISPPLIGLASDYLPMKVAMLILTVPVLVSALCWLFPASTNGDVQNAAS